MKSLLRFCFIALTVFFITSGSGVAKGVEETVAPLDKAIDKLFDKISESESKAAQKIMLSASSFYEMDSGVSMPLAVGIAAHITERLKKVGIDVYKPPAGPLNGWIIKGYWSIYDDKMTMSLQAVPWVDGNRDKMIMVPVTVPLKDVDKYLDAEENLDVWGRTLVHRLETEIPLSKVQRIYISSYEGADEEKDFKFISRLSQWIKTALSASITMQPIDIEKEFENISEDVLMERALKPRLSLMADLLAADMEISGEIETTPNEIIVNSFLKNNLEEEPPLVPVAFPADMLPREFRPRNRLIRRPRRRDIGRASKKAAFSLNDLKVELTSSRGSLMPEYKSKEQAKFFIRANKSSYIYIINASLGRGGRRNRNQPIMLYPAKGQKSEIIQENSLLIVKPETMKRGKSFVWVIASENNLDMKLMTRNGSLRSNLMRQFMEARDKAKEDGKGHGEARILVSR